MQKSKIKIYLVFVMVLFVGILFFSLKDNFKDIIFNLSHVKVLWLILGIIFVFISRYLIGVTIYKLGVKENKNLSLSRMVEIAIIYNFYAGITPSSVGGEGFEVFYLKQCGIPFGSGTNIQMQKFILYGMSLITINVLAVIFNFFTGIVVDSSFVGSAVTLNFIVNLALLGGGFLITYNRWIKNFILSGGVNILSKVRVIKEPDKFREKIDEFIIKFDEGTKTLHKDRKLFIKLFIYNVLSILFLTIAAWPIARAMHINSIGVINLFVLAAYAKMMCLLVVTPGNSGAAEYCFIYLFNKLIPEDGIMAYMLIWRLITYYVPLVAGGILAMKWERRRVHEEIISAKS